MRAHLHGLRRTGRGRRHDGRMQTAGRRIRRHRSAAIAGAVLQHLTHALRAQQRQHHAGTAILEAAGGHEPLALQQRRRAIQRAADQRRAALAQGDRLIRLERQCRAIAPQAAGRSIDLRARQARKRRQQQRRAVETAPARLLQREGLAGPRVKIRRRHGRSVRRGLSRGQRRALLCLPASRRLRLARKMSPDHVRNLAGRSRRAEQKALRLSTAVVSQSRQLVGSLDAAGHRGQPQ